MREVKIGELGKVEFYEIGGLKVSFPFIISSNRLTTAFIYDLFEGRFVNAKSIDHENKQLVFELEPNDHVLFAILCNDKICALRLFNIHVKRELRYYGDYDQEETEDVVVSEIYNAKLYRDMYRSISNCKDTPDILAFVLAYLVPIDLPEVHYRYSTPDEIVNDVKNFFES